MNDKKPDINWLGIAIMVGGALIIGGFLLFGKSDNAPYTPGCSSNGYEQGC